MSDDISGRHAAPLMNVGRGAYTLGGDYAD